MRAFPKAYIKNSKSTCGYAIGAQKGSDLSDTVGKNTKKIQEYIANQLKEDHETDQMKLNEYIDPFTGEPVQKSKK